jgi:hypothetical protein
VQGWAADDRTEGEIYEPVTCIACGRIHLVNSKSGKVLEAAKKQGGLNGELVAPAAWRCLPQSFAPHPC